MSVGNHYIQFAISVVDGGITVDNDVMNVGFWPIPCIRYHIPALMYATGQEYDGVIHYMANYTLIAMIWIRLD